MKITIDTYKKTLEIIDEISIKELNEFIEKYKLQNYTIKSYYQYENKSYNAGYTLFQPTVTPC